MSGREWAAMVATSRMAGAWLAGVVVTVMVVAWLASPKWEPLPIREQSKLSLHIDMGEVEIREAIDAVAAETAQSGQAPNREGGQQWAVTRPVVVDVDPRNPFAATSKDGLCMTAAAFSTREPDLGEIRLYEQQDGRCDFAEAESWWVLNEAGSWAPVSRDEVAGG